jgi:hypothetical protein
MEIEHPLYIHILLFSNSTSFHLSAYWMLELKSLNSVVLRFLRFFQGGLQSVSQEPQGPLWFLSRSPRHGLLHWLTFKSTHFQVHHRSPFRSLNVSKPCCHQHLRRVPVRKISHYTRTSTHPRISRSKELFVLILRGYRYFVVHTQ